jgi:hypothetical protein
VDKYTYGFAHQAINGIPLVGRNGGIPAHRPNCACGGDASDVNTPAGAEEAATISSMTGDRKAVGEA